jgi:hypothetical protein
LILYSKQHKPRRKMVGVLDNLNKGQVQPLFQAAPAGGSYKCEPVKGYPAKFAPANHSRDKFR